MLAISGLLFLAVSCRGGGHDNDLTACGDTLTRNATLLTLIDAAPGVTVAHIANPWASDEYLERYMLVDTRIADSVPDLNGYMRIVVPVRSALVYSDVHAAPLYELGAASVVKGVSEVRYFTTPEVVKGVAEGTIVDVGNAMSPNLESIVSLSPQIAIVSPYENSGHGILDKTGIKVIDMADYMEPTPLARAEWILLLGALAGRLEEARNIYEDVVVKYTEASVPKDDDRLRPVVLTEVPYSGVWYQPGGKSYMAALIRDAGGKTLFPDDETTGSLQLDVATVLDRGAEADVWLIKTTEAMSSLDLPDIVPGAELIKAFRNGHVYFFNTSGTQYYNDLAFHPERILEKYKAVLNSKF